MPTESCKVRFSDSTWHPRNDPAPANSLDSGLNSNDNNDPFRDNSLSQPRGAVSERYRRPRQRFPQPSAIMTNLSTLSVYKNEAGPHCLFPRTQGLFPTDTP